MAFYLQSDSGHSSLTLRTLLFKSGLNCTFIQKNLQIKRYVSHTETERLPQCCFFLCFNCFFVTFWSHYEPFDLCSDQAKPAKHCFPKLLKIRIQMNKNIQFSLPFLISALRRSETLSSTNMS